jgi:hypothetical protein
MGKTTSAGQRDCTVTADTLEEAHKEVERQNTRRSRKGQPPITVQREEIVNFGPRVFRSEPSEHEMQRFRQLLPREVAKIAVEYVAHVAGPDVALSPTLDDIRSYAMTGEPPIAVGGEHLGSPVYWLPRTRRFQAVAGDAEEMALVREMLAPYEQSHDSAWQPPADFPRLTDIYHQLAVRRHGEVAWFSLVLFGWLAFDVKLSADLPLPWNTGVRKVFRPRAAEVRS